MMSLFWLPLEVVPLTWRSPIKFCVVHPGFAAPEVELVVASMITPVLEPPFELLFDFPVVVASFPHETKAA